MEQNEDGKLVSESNPSRGWITERLKELFDRRTMFGDKNDKPQGIANYINGVQRDTVVHNEIKKYGRAIVGENGREVLEHANTMDVLKAARLQIENSFRPRGWLSKMPDGEYKYEPITFDQNMEAKIKYMDGIQKSMREDFHKIMFGQSFRINDEVIDPDKVKVSGQPFSPIREIEMGYVNHNFDSMRYALHTSAMQAGKTAEAFDIVGQVIRRRAEEFSQVPLNIVMNPMSVLRFMEPHVNRGWMNHGGDFNIIIKNKRIWKEEYSGVTGPAW